MKKYENTMSEGYQEYAKKFIENNVIMCATSLIEDLLSNETLINIDEFENLYNEETEEYNEVFEYWFVNEWFFNKLKEEKEIVCDSKYGYIWGRTTSGQAIYIWMKQHLI